MCVDDDLHTQSSCLHPAASYIRRCRRRQLLSSVMNFKTPQAFSVFVQQTLQAGPRKDGETRNFDNSS